MAQTAQPGQLAQTALPSKQSGLVLLAHLVASHRTPQHPQQPKQRLRLQLVRVLLSRLVWEVFWELGFWQLLSLCNPFCSGPEIEVRL